MEGIASVTAAVAGTTTAVLLPSFGVAVGNKEEEGKDECQEYDAL